MSRLAKLLDGLDDEVARAKLERTRGRGGQHVPFHGDFAGCSITSLKRLEWWLRELRAALIEEAGR